ncbi:uncharacterized protein LOC113201683, partial [Frankliniella occidentalis]|uniref:Uncharacterized protein LOC113201683 n=1 Tax=Frankliniella occidentalis TaxID=133901 RepID=A0A9C6XVB5_FRAOC
WCCGVLATIVLLLASVGATPRQDTGFLRADSAAHHKDAVHYKYQYAVDDRASGVVNDRWEQRNGDFVKGQYSLLDPDGKVRTVDYEVDGERGFHAVVRTQYPAPSLLSIQSASQVHEVYQDSPVNVRAKNGVGVPSFALKNPRFSVRDNLPFNYHALDAAKLGIDTEEDGARLQLLDEEGPLSAKEAHRRKYHRENHLLPHENIFLHDQQDQFIQQDTRQDLRQDLRQDFHQDLRLTAYDPLLDPNRNVYPERASVFNPRAAYINLRPRPAPLSPLPPPNPPPHPSDVLLLPAHRRSPPPAPARPAYAAPVPGSNLVTGSFLYPPSSTQVGLHTLAILPPAPTSSRASYAAPGIRFATAASAPRSRIVQHLTETSPGLSASRSYYLR